MLTGCQRCLVVSNLGVDSRGQSLPDRSELLSRVEHMAKLKPLLRVGIIVCRDDGTENARAGVIMLCNRQQPVDQLVVGFAEGPEDQLDLPGTTRDIIVHIVGIPNGKTILIAEDLYQVSNLTETEC